MSKRRNPLEPVEEAAELLVRRSHRPRRGRDRSWDARRSKATYDLPAELIERIREIADELAAEHQGARVRVNDVARLLLEAGLERYEAGELATNLKPTGFTLFDD